MFAIPDINNWPSGGMTGRRAICTDCREVSPENVEEVMGKARAIHLMNWAEINYLYDYYRGKQDVRNKVKVTRPEINNKVTVNRANEIVTFKTAYFLSEPIQYVSAGGEDRVSANVARLNSYMMAENKESKDEKIVDWMHICGVGVRIVLPDSESETEGSPVCIYSEDPRLAYCIYWSGLGNKRLAGVLIQRDEDGQFKECVWTPEWYFELKDGKTVKQEARTVPYVPVIEYLNNNARMGAFESVIPLLNAINDVTSNRADAIQDFVNAYDVFQNCEVDESTYSELTSGGKAINIKSPPGQEAKVYRISSALDQGNTQTVIDDMYDAVLTICGMPNRNGGSSTSDTGAATIFRDGWESASSRAKDTELMYNDAEREFLKIVLYICGNTGDLRLELADIKIEHTRNNLSNMQSRVQILCECLNNDKIHPKIAWTLAGIPNAEEWYRISEQYYEEQQEALNEQLEMENEALRKSGQDDSDSEETGDTAIQESAAGGADSWV